MSSRAPVLPVRRSFAARSLGLLAAASCLLGACGAKTEPAPPTSVPTTVASSSGDTKSTGTIEGAGGGSTTVVKTPKTTVTTESTGTTSTTKPAGATGASCRTVDLGGLTVAVACGASVPEPESGVTLTSDSVYGLPGESFDELADVDATNRVVTTPDGKPVTIYLLGSDTLFDVGSSTVKSTAEAALPEVVASINKRAPNAKILVRGFTDSTGSASSNQTLSEQRAAAMVAWLAAHGLSPARLEASGYGSTHPAAEETTADGTALNRRIELVALG